LVLEELSPEWVEAATLHEPKTKVGLLEKG